MTIRSRIYSRSILNGSDDHVANTPCTAGNLMEGASRAYSSSSYRRESTQSARAACVIPGIGALLSSNRCGATPGMLRSPGGKRRGNYEAELVPNQRLQGTH